MCKYPMKMTRRHFRCGSHAFFATIVLFCRIHMTKIRKSCSNKTRFLKTFMQLENLHMISLAENSDVLQRTKTIQNKQQLSLCDMIFVRWRSSWLVDIHRSITRFFSSDMNKFFNISFSNSLNNEVTECISPGGGLRLSEGRQVGTFTGGMWEEGFESEIFRLKCHDIDHLTIVDLQCASGVSIWC